MNLSRKTIYLALLTLLVLTTVVAQTFDEKTAVEKPPARQYDTGHCFEYQVKMLYAATQIGNPDQESYLRAASAYEQLDALGQKC